MDQARNSGTRCDAAQGGACALLAAWSEMTARLLDRQVPGLELIRQVHADIEAFALEGATPGTRAEAPGGRPCWRYAPEGRACPTAPLTARVEQLVARRLGEADISLPAIAGALGMSPRSLSRKLAARGTSFQQVTDRLRRDLALHYVGEAGLSVTETAFRLGYAEVSCFSRAFRRWTGQSPQAVRLATEG